MPIPEPARISAQDRPYFWLGAEADEAPCYYAVEFDVAPEDMEPGAVIWMKH